MERDMILNGIAIGEHAFVPEEVIAEIRERCIDKGFNFVSLRPRSQDPVFEQDYFIRWAEYCRENQLYFMIVYSAQQPPAGKENWVDADTAVKMKEIAGEYFLGDLLGEPGSMYACKLAGYYMEKDTLEYHKRRRNYRLKLDCEDMKEAHEEYVKTFSQFVERDKKIGMGTLCVEATSFAKYNAECGVDIPILEVLPGSPDFLLPVVRGVARAFDSKMWGTYVAHEWYGGFRHEDELKKKRLSLAYKHSYLSGSQMFMLESGDTCVHSYGCDYDYDSDICKNYRDVLEDMREFIKRDIRPKGGPKVKVAFVSGLHDGWAGKWGFSSLWSQFYREEWGYNEAEHSWMMLNELYTKRIWDDVMNYGDYDYSGAPGYGLYDIIPIEADVDKLLRYDYLIFLGWNSMTEENMDKLTAYVRGGGHLLMTAAHLNTQTQRDGKFRFVSDEKIEELFGCRFMGEFRRTNSGAKFGRESLDPSVLYPVYKAGGSDPILMAGFSEFARFATCDSTVIATAADGFHEKYSDLPMVIENKLGKGVATLVTSTDYPGNGAIYPLYRAMVREFMAASARNCEVKVISSDRLRYSVYEGGKMYLLNTDYDLPIFAKIIAGEKEYTERLEPLELITLKLYI